MNRSLICIGLLILLGSPAWADPASRARLEKILKDPAQGATSARLLHAIGSQDLNLDRGEIIRALSAAGAPPHARLILGMAASLKSRSGAVHIDRLLTTDVKGPARMIRVGADLSYRVSGSDLVDIRGLQSGTSASTLRPITRVGNAAAPKPIQPLVQPIQPLAQPVQPAVQPVQPLVQPVQPAVQPTQPLVQPTQPAVQPTQPAVQPTQPAVQPTQPAVGIDGALRNMLANGSRGDEVRRIQARINARLPAGDHAVKEDGIFGSKTEAAIREFQRREGLPVTGQIDAPTQGALAKPPRMRRGAKGEDVRRLQQLLNRDRRARGLAPIGTDGKFGRRTERALEDFQRSRGMDPSGVVTNQTEDALRTARPAAAGHASPLLERGDRGEGVRALQFRLNEQREAAGRPVIERDSNFGRATERALKEFQRERGLPATGIADPATWAELRKLPDDTSAGNPTALTRGAKGNDVKALQSRINRHREAAHKSPIGVDGDFGAATERAIREFQGANSDLATTGVLDAATLTALNAEPPAIVPHASDLPAPTSDGSLRGLKIGIDSGHGTTGSRRFDPGSVNRRNGITEYELNRRVSTRVSALLRARGAAVSLQSYPRGAPARSLFQKGSQVARGQHLFLSIHHNSANSSAQGSMVLVHQSLATTSSFKLARAIQSRLVSGLWGGARSRDRGVRRQGLGVLRGAHGQVRTAVLVEGFFLDPSNVTQAVADAWIEREAQAIAAGVADYWASR